MSRQRSNSLPDLTKKESAGDDRIPTSPNLTSTNTKRKARTPTILPHTTNGALPSRPEPVEQREIGKRHAPDRAFKVDFGESKEREEERGNGMQDTGDDESFFDLLQTFAKMDLPKADESVLEKCPLCPEVFPIAEFTPHVYQCIKKLDHEEQKYLETKDAELAAEFARRQGIAADQSLHQFQSAPVGSPCPQGLACRRYDLTHHHHFTHPEVTCPICCDLYPVFEIDAHVGFCVESGGGGGGGGGAGGGMMSDDGGTKKPPAPAPAPFQFKGAAFTDARETSREDDAEDEDAAAPTIPTMGLERQESGEVPCGLTKSQMKAMATMVVQQKNKATSNQDVSLVQLLDTFKTLGFTKENLSKAL